MSFLHATFDDHIEGKAIVIPIVSTANIGQLAVDLLIRSLSLAKIGDFDPHYFVPVVGAREDGQNGITTPFELFGRADVDLVVLQQRSPVLKARKDEFISDLLKFIKRSKPSAVLFLSGVDLSNRTDSQMLTPIYHIRPLNTSDFTGTPLNNLSNLPIPLYTSPVQSNPSLAHEGVKLLSASTLEVPFIPGGGLTRRILTSISTQNEWNIPTASLVQFVLEGDNRADAGLLASVTARILGKEVSLWKEPGSWRDGLFGTPHDQSLYG